MINNPEIKYKQIVITIVILIALEAGIYWINHRYALFTPFFQVNSASSFEMHEGGGEYTNPLLECMNTESDGSTTELNISKKEMESFVDNILAEKKVDVVSVYIRDLNNGPWLGINQDETFIGSSLLKVPILITYMNLAESNPGILNAKVKYDRPIIDNNQYFPLEKELLPGNEYTVEELLEYMIKYSDNNAAAILVDSLPPGEIDKTFQALGLSKPEFDQPYEVTIRNYASFFRILFNASYLNKTYSEKALEMLAQTTFNLGIKAPLPSQVEVAHKFGVRSDNNGVNQLHDCGIVYYPGHPYLMCVMTKGGEFTDLEDAINRVSGFVYKQIDAKFSKKQ